MPGDWIEHSWSTGLTLRDYGARTSAACPLDLFLRSGRGLWWTTYLDKAQSYHCCASQTEIYSSGARVVPVENNGQPGSAPS